MEGYHIIPQWQVYFIGFTTKIPRKAQRSLSERSPLNAIMNQFQIPLKPNVS